MRVLLAVVLLFALVLSGCARQKAAPGSKSGPARSKTGVAAPKAAATGEVSVVNPAARFVVLTFPRDPMPFMDQRMNLYRGASKVAEVKVTGPQRGRNIVADIVTGAPEPGDEARAD
ncbi:MAG: hypothetical protein WCL11_03420 [Verrucomicrobiota bacterium]|nr:hypothetical protein [Verrucomicrobiota bacterium]